MGWITELNSFYESIMKYHERDLDKNKIVKDFLGFMENQYGYQSEYFTNGFQEVSQKFTDLDDYIYRYHIGLEGNLRYEYSRLLSEAKQRVKKYNEKVNSLNNKVANESEIYTKEKLKFY